MASVAKEWREIPGRYNLSGSKCGCCGRVFFPRRNFCPYCRRASIGRFVDYDVCKTGEVYTYSIIHEAPIANDLMKPYAVVMVRTDDGVMISAQLVDVDLDRVEIGMRVRAVLRKLDSDGQDGVIHYGYKFVPIE